MSEMSIDQLYERVFPEGHAEQVMGCPNCGARVVLTSGGGEVTMRFVRPLETEFSIATTFTGYHSCPPPEPERRLL